MWCDKKVSEPQEHGSRKRKSNGDGAPVPKVSKTEEYEQETLEIVDELREIHSDKYTVPQYKLWAKYILAKRHSSYDTPPEIPLITGTPVNRKHTKETFNEAVAGAATAIVQALKPTTPVRPSSSLQGISPVSHANLRRRHLEDIRTLHSLYEDNILSLAEYQEQKQSVLSNLRDLTQ